MNGEEKMCASRKRGEKGRVTAEKQTNEKRIHIFNPIS